MADPRPHMTLTCYNDTHGYGWKHVDLFVREASGLELNWVHWGVSADGPMLRDEVTATVEPTLLRTSEWPAPEERKWHGLLVSGYDKVRVGRRHIAPRAAAEW